MAVGLDAPAGVPQVSTSIDSLRSERRRKLQVRESFSRGLQYFRDRPEEDPTGFYLACAGYLVTGQRRLIDQDRRLLARLAPLVPSAQQADHEAMHALGERLDLADRSLREFSAATEELRRHGTMARCAFEEAAARFLDFLVNVLGARSHSLRHLTTTMLNEGDWQHILGLTPEVTAEERRAFDEVSRRAPQGMAPEAIAARAAVERAENLRGQAS